MLPVLNYCTILQLQTLGVSAAAIAKYSAARQTEAIEAASRKIDSYLRAGGRYTLPLVQVGTDLARCCAIITTYDLLSSKGLNPEGTDENVRLRYKDELAWLMLVSSGEVIPDITDSGAGAAEGVPSGGARVVSATSRGYSVRGTGNPRGAFQSD